MNRVGAIEPLRPRTIGVRFEIFADRETVLRNARKLKGSGVLINEDRCAASQALRTSQLPQLKQAINYGKRAFFMYTRLVIKDLPVQRTYNSASMSPLPTTASGSHLSTSASASPVRNNSASLGPDGGAAAMTTPATNNGDHSQSDGVRGAIRTSVEGSADADADVSSGPARTGEASDCSQRQRYRKNTKKNVKK